MLADIAFFLLRLGLALMLFPHGAQKALGWFGGPGIAGTVGFMAQVGVPPPVAYLVIAVEFVGPVLLVLGVLPRLVALAMLVDMTAAPLIVYGPNGLVANFLGAPHGEPVEFFLLAVTIALALVVGGPGRFALMRRF